MFLKYRNFKYALNRKESIENKIRLLNTLTFKQFSQAGGPKLFINSIPKSGTHLINRCLSLMPEIEYSGCFINYLNNNDRFYNLGNYENLLKRLPANTYISSHMPYTAFNEELLNRYNYKSILLVRDPRDVLVSQANFYEKRVSNRWYGHFASIDSFEQKLKTLFHGVLLKDMKGTAPMSLPSFEEWYKQYLNWHESGSLVVRFEDLIGEKGGGSIEKQVETVKNVAGFCGLGIDNDQANEIAAKVYNPRSNTFHKGMIGQWEPVFSAELKDAFKEKFNRILVEFDYESDSNW